MDKELLEKQKRWAMKQIIELTATTDLRDGSVWGNDTDCGNIEKLIDAALEIIARNKLKILSI